MIPFKVVSPNIDELSRNGERPERLVERLAIEKAQAVAAVHPDSLIIGSDQVAVHDGIVVGKPRDHKHAVEQLRGASGKSITLHTGIAVINTTTNRIQSDVVPYTVTFRDLTDCQIEQYLSKEQPYGCSGSLRADGLGIVMLKRFEGDDPTALIGLPLIRLITMLENEGVKIL